MKESNLSPPVLAKNKGTVVFRLVPLQGEVSESVPRTQTYTTSEQIISMNTVLPSAGFIYPRAAPPNAASSLSAPSGKNTVPPGR